MATRGRGLIPVVGVDEQMQVAGVQVIHNVLAVGVDHLHIVLHFLLHRKRKTAFAGTRSPGPLPSTSILRVMQVQR